MKNPVKKVEDDVQPARSYRVFRGGSLWEHQEVRSRDNYNPEAVDVDLGFRIVKNS